VELNNPEKNLNKLFLISRIANSIFFVIIIFVFSKICKIFDVENYLILFSLLSIIISNSFIENLTKLRADVVAIALALTTWYFILSFIKYRKNIYYIFLSGFFLLLSLLAKIQIVILFLPIFLFIPIFVIFEIKDDKFYILKYFKLYLIFYFFFIVVYFSLQVFINQHPRFVNQNYVDLIIFIFINLSFLSYLYFISFKNKTIFKINFSIFILLIIGVSFSLLFLLFLSYFNIIKLSPYILLRLTNPFYYLKVYTPLEDASVNTGLTFKFLSLIFSEIKIDIKNFTILLLIFIYSSIRNFIFNDKKNIIYNSIIFSLFLLIIFSFNLRYYVIYDLYYLPIYYLLISLCFRKIKKKYLVVLLLLIFLINNNFFIAKYDWLKINYNKDVNLVKICSEREIREFYWWWGRKLDENFFKNLCVKEKIKFLKGKSKYFDE
jgi:hypothetical protein